ncbi:MAG: hypothetical protein ACI4J8_01280 [Oscillospiraceae bacterium]
MKKIPFSEPKFHYGELSDDEGMNISSADDCTGLIPAAVLDDEQYDSYAELYSFLPPEGERRFNNRI